MITDEEKKKKRLHYDRYGNIKPDGAPMADGDRIAPPLMMMDSLSPSERAELARPFETPPASGRSIALSDEEIATRTAAYERKEKALGDAWRNPPPIDQGEFRSGSAPDEGDRYAARDARLCTRWRDAL